MDSNIQFQLNFTANNFKDSYWKSFKGIADLYGINNLAHFAQTQVIVIGIGGVGSWVAESLARTGIGSLVLIDADDVCLSNINRQLIALHSTKGDDKVEVLANRCQDINPLINLQTYTCFLNQDNLKELIRYHPFTLNAFTSNLINPEVVMVIDAMDNAVIKAHLINYCRQNKLKLVVCGAAGGKINPQLVKIADITETYQDPLLANIRNKLRREFGYNQRFKNKKFGVPSVFSSEQLKIPNQAEVCNLNKLNCSNGYGSSVAVTSVFGNMAVSKVLDFICQSNKFTLQTSTSS